MGLLILTVLLAVFLTACGNGGGGDETRETGSTTVKMGSSSLTSLAKTNKMATMNTLKTSYILEGHRVIIQPKKVTGLMEKRLAFAGEYDLNSFWPIGGLRNPCEFFPELIDFDFTEINTFIDNAEDIYRNEAQLGTYDTIKLQFICLDFTFDFNETEYILRLYFNRYGDAQAGDIQIKYGEVFKWVSEGDGTLVETRPEDPIQSIALSLLWEWYQLDMPSGCDIHIVDFILDNVSIDTTGDGIADSRKTFTMDSMTTDVQVTVDLDFSSTVAFSQYPTIDSEGNVDTNAPILFDIEEIENLSVVEILKGMTYPMIYADPSIQFLD